MGCPQRRALRGGAAEDRDATKHRDGAEESARAKVTCAQRLRRAERRAAPSFDGAADGCCADQEDTLKGVPFRAGRVKATKKGTTVVARWPACGTLRKAALTGLIAPDCNSMTVTFKARKTPPRTFR